MNKVTSKNKKTIPYDKMQSTYYWKILLNQNNNDNHVEHLTGYSKKRGQDEAQDLVYLLQSKIIMFQQNNYLNKNRVDRIEIFKRETEIINKKTDPCLIILFDKTFTIPVSNHQEYVLKTFGKFLNDFYKCVIENRNTADLIRSKKKPVSKDDFLNPDRVPFRNIQHLYSYSVRLLDNGHATGQVNHFINQVKSKYNWE
jgi:hypothetical protein